MIYRRSEREMPAFRFEYENSKLEGVQFCFQAQPVAIRPSASDPRRVGALDTWVGYHPQLEAAILPQTEKLAAEMEALLAY